MKSSAVLGGFALVTLGLTHCGPPVLNTPVTDIPKLASLDAVMDTQATTADPQMGKAGQTSFSDADWVAFADTSSRIQATSLKIKDFSRGPDFDALASQLGEKAKALGDAAGAKDVAKANAALTEMKATCKACHSKFR